MKSRNVAIYIALIVSALIWVGYRSDKGFLIRVEGVTAGSLKNSEEGMVFSGPDREDIRKLNPINWWPPEPPQDSDNSDKE